MRTRNYRIKIHTSVIIALFLASPAAFPRSAETIETTSTGPTCTRIVTIGDLHGNYQGFVTILKETGLIDDDLAWLKDEGACLVQLGDILDRGKHPRKILDLLIDLQRQDPDHVFVLLGNHETLNMVEHLEYVDPEAYMEFAGEESIEEREEWFALYRDLCEGEALDESSCRKRFDTLYPGGWFARRKALSPEGDYGRWLRSLPVILKLGDNLFVHGGLPESYLGRAMDDVSAQVHEEMARYYRIRGELIEAGLLTIFDPYVDTGDLASIRLGKKVEKQAALEETLPELILPRYASELAAVAEIRALLASNTYAVDGVLWDRDLAYAEEETYSPVVDRVLQETGTARIIAGHTTNRSHRVVSRFTGRVFLIDTGIGEDYGNHLSALEIRDDLVRAIYPDECEIMVPPRFDDEEMARILSEGEILDIEEMPAGSTGPKKLTIASRKGPVRAVFKTVDVHIPGVSQVKDREPEINFSDKYKYEPAAYYLDRMLGLNMVPVAVTRTVQGEEGAVVEWIPGAMNSTDQRKRKLKSPDKVRFGEQRYLMKLFDALIQNTDRNQGNMLYTWDWKLHLIDHSRAFRYQRSVPDPFLMRQVRIPRQVYAALRDMDVEQYWERCKGLLSKTQVKAVFARRDIIVDMIEERIADLGEEAVFTD